MASLQALQRSVFRAGGVATAATFFSTVAGDRSVARVTNQAVGKCNFHHASPLTTTTTTSSSTVSNTSIQSLHQAYAASARRQPQHRNSSTSVPKAVDTATTTTTSTTVSEAAATTTKASSSSSSSSSTSFVQWYEGHLQSNPVATKMVTGGILWSVGDAVAQLVPQVTANVSSEHNNQTKPFQYDLARTGRAAFFGFFIHAPTSHVHFNFLEWMTQKGGFTGLSIPVFKTIMEQFVYWSWISNSMYHAFMGYAQGMNTSQVIQRIDDVLWDTQKAQWAFWIPVQLLNFQFVPVRHQLNVVLLTSIVWTALLSAWYPPVDEDKAEVFETEDGKKTPQ